MAKPRHDPFDPATFARVDALLERALDLEGAERSRYLDEACAGDAPLRRRLDALIVADTTGDVLLDEPLDPRAARLLAAPAGEPGPDAFAGRRFGPWRALHELGRGGMGAVWLAERGDGAYEQKVALKLVPGAPASRSLREGFERERRILARLEHPNIARLLDGGVTDEGLPWLAMEYVEGEPLTHWCDARRADLATRLRLFEAVGAAVSAAHQRLVVHRDLKPSNILVTPAGEPKLLDFGIARLLEPGTEDDGTRTLERRLTPRYASPEQLRGEPPTTATDVWALGVILDLLLTGRHPFASEGADVRALERAVLEREPTRPSRVAAADAEPPVPAAALGGDLDAIVLQALRKEPERRYPSVQAMLDDLHRHRTGRPVRAMPPSPGYRAGKFLRRHRGPIALGALAVLALVAGLVATTRQARIARVERDRATRMMKFLAGTFTGAGPERPTIDFAGAGSADPDRPVRTLVGEAAVRARAELADDPAALGAVELALGEALLAMRRDREADTALTSASAAFAGVRDAKGVSNADHLRALALLDESRVAEAESLMYTTLPYWRARPGRELEVATLLLSLERVQRRRGEPRAESTLAEAWALIDPRVPEEHLLRLQGLAARANAEMATGRDTTAESLLRRTAPLAERRLGPLHPITLTARTNLGTCLYRQQKWAEAESLLRGVASDRERVLGPDHPDVTNPLNTLAMCLRDMGRLAEADSLFRRVLATRVRLLGPDARESLASEMGLANLLVLRGRAVEAEPRIRRVLAIRRRQLPPNDPLLAGSLGSLGEALEAQRRWAEAESAWREALAIREAANPPKAKDVEKAKAALVRLRAAGR